MPGTMSPATPSSGRKPRKKRNTCGVAMKTVVASPVPEPEPEVKTAKIHFVHDSEVEEVLEKVKPLSLSLCRRKRLSDVHGGVSMSHDEGDSDDEESQDEAVKIYGKYRIPSRLAGGDNVGRERSVQTPTLPAQRLFGFSTPKAAKKTPTVGSAQTPAALARGKSKLPENKATQSDAYFEAQSSSCGPEMIHTSDRTLNHLKTPRLSQEALDKLLAREKPRHATQMDQLARDQRRLFPKWLRLLHEDFNLVLYGVGSKQKLLRDFHASCLADEDCVVVNGFFPAVTLRHLLNAIVEDVIEYEGTFSGGQAEQVDFICDWFSRPQTTSSGDEVRRLYLLVHNIDGLSLRGDKSQSVLARLAAQAHIHVVCTIDHINAPLIWDQQKMSLFNFVWYDVTSFRDYKEEIRNETSFMVKQSGALALNSLKHVFASLASNAKEIYILIVRYQMDVTSSSIKTKGDQTTYQGISFTDLYLRCRDKHLVNSDLTLRAQLTEFRDHKLIATKTGQDGLDYLTIPLNNFTLKEFLDSQCAE